jgi:hypothetical protein
MKPISLTRRLLAVGFNLVGGACFIVGLVETRDKNELPWLSIIGFVFILVGLSVVFRRAKKVETSR